MFEMFTSFFHGPYQFPDLDPVALPLGPVVIRWYALAYIAGFLLGWFYCVRMVRRWNSRPTPGELDDFLTWAIVGVLVGGRLGYVLFYNLDTFLAHPLEIVELWHGGMSFHGGLTGVVLALYLFTRKIGMPMLQLADVVAAAAPIGLFFGRLANFVNGELFGRATTMPWGVIFPHGGPLPRHPSQIYEALLEGLLLFLVLAVLARRRWVMAHTGVLSGVFLAGYALCRLSVEQFREPDQQLGFLWGGITMGQLLSLPVLIAGLAILAWACAHKHPVAALPSAGEAGPS